MTTDSQPHTGKNTSCTDVNIVAVVLKMLEKSPPEGIGKKKKHF